MKKAITVITTCKGRLVHLKQTLPGIVAQEPAEIIVVDYDCPDGAGDWVEQNFPSVKLVRSGPRKEFCLAEARNLGAAQASSPWLFLIDADILVQPQLFLWLDENLPERVFCRSGKQKDKTERQLSGTLLCPSADFRAAGQYDVCFRGWGNEDQDFYYRLGRCGLLASYFPAALVAAIHHGDEMRMRFYVERDKAVTALTNRLYSAAKRYALARLNSQGDLPMPLREDLYRQAKEAACKKKRLCLPWRKPVYRFTLNASLGSLPGTDGGKHDFSIIAKSRSSLLLESELR